MSKFKIPMPMNDINNVKVQNFNVNRNRLDLDVYEKLKRSLNEAVQYHKGKKNLKTLELLTPDPPNPMKAKDIVKLRASLKVSQSIFSEILNVSVKTVQAWEAGRRQSAQSALRLLEIIKDHPEYVYRKN